MANNHINNEYFVDVKRDMEGLGWEASHESKEIIELIKAVCS